MNDTPTAALRGLIRAIDKDDEKAYQRAVARARRILRGKTKGTSGKQPPQFEDRWLRRVLALPSIEGPR